MNYLVVAPKFVNRPGEYYAFPLGLAYIAAALKAAGHSTRTLNLNHCTATPEVAIGDAVREWRIDVICTGGLSPHFLKVKQVVDAAQAARAGVITVVGGGIVSAQPEFMVKNLGCTCGVLGEGEDTVVELAGALSGARDLGKVTGLVYRNAAGLIVRTDDRAPITDLDRVAFPDYEGFGLEFYLDLQTPSSDRILYPFDDPRNLPFIMSRSCPFRCTFCFHPLGNRYRQRSLDNVFTELDLLAGQYRINSIVILDELFSADRERVIEFCERIRPFGLKWMPAMRVDGVDRDLLKIMKSAGCYHISYGIESACDKILKSMRKHISVRQIETALDLTQEVGIGFVGNLLFGDVEETWETAQESLDWWRRNPRFQINLSPVFAYPGTFIYDEAVRTGVIRDELEFIKSGSRAINFSKMTDEQYRQLVAQIEQYNVEPLVSGELLECELVASSQQSRTYRFSARCPHCSLVSRYGNAQTSGGSDFKGFRKLSCRHCNQKFDLPSFQGNDNRLAEKVAAIVARHPPGRIGIWGAGEHTRFLLGHTVLSRDNVATIFDSNTLKHGIEIDGIRVESFSEPDARQELDAIIISSKLFEAEIFQDLAHLEEHGIAVYKLYDQGESV